MANNICLLVNLDLFASLNAHAWIVHKNKPNKPLLKLTKNEFELIKSGVYKQQHNMIYFNGKKYYISTDLFDKLKHVLKNNDLSLNDLAISMQEFYNVDAIDGVKLIYDKENIKLLKNTSDTLIFYTEKFLYKTHDAIIKKIFDDLKTNDVLSNSLIYLNKNLSNNSESDIAYKKVVKVLELLFGYDVTKDGFKNKLETRFNIVKVFDDNDDSFSQLKDIQYYLEHFLEKTKNDEIKNDIIEYINESRPYVDLNTVTTNRFNKIITKTIILEKPLDVKTFETFSNIENFKMIVESIDTSKPNIEDVLTLINYEDSFKDLYPSYSEDSEYYDDYMYDTKEDAYNAVQSVIDMFNELPNPIPLYRTIKVKSLDDIDYNYLGEAWSFDKESALNFAKNQAGGNVLLTALCDKDNVDWDATYRNYFHFSGVYDNYDENEIVVSDTDLLKDVKADYIKNLVSNKK